MVVFFDNGGVHQTATIVLFHTQMEIAGVGTWYKFHVPVLRSRIEYHR